MSSVTLLFENKKKHPSSKPVFVEYAEYFLGKIVHTNYSPDHDMCIQCILSYLNPFSLEVVRMSE